MKLSGEEVLPAHRRAEARAAVVGFSRDAGGILGPDDVRVHKIEIFAWAHPSCRCSRAGLDLIPSHVWHLHPAVSRKARDSARKDAEAFARALLLAFVEQDLQPETDPEVGL